MDERLGRVLMFCYKESSQELLINSSLALAVQMLKFLGPTLHSSIPKSTLSLLLLEPQDKVTLHIRLLSNPYRISQSGGKYVL